MPVTQYIGSRYVPLFSDPIEWSASNTYEPLTIVIHEGNSYTSKQAVPKGIDIANEDFWALTGNYNAQVELYRRETAAAKAAADNAQADATAAQTDIDTLLPKSDFSVDNTVKKYVDDSAAQVQADIDTLLPKAAFSAENTVKKYVDDSIVNTLDTYYIRPEAYGAIGDGITDDTTAFETMLSALIAPNKTKVIVCNPSKTYLLKNLIIDANNIVFIGNGCTVKSNEASCFIISKNAHDIVIDNINFENTFELGSTTAQSNYGIGTQADNTDEIYDAYNITITNCTFKCGVFGIVLNSTLNTHIENCVFKDGYFRPEDRAGGYGILIQSCINTFVDNCYFKMGMYSRHEIYVSVAQTKTANKSNVNVFITNINADKSLILEYNNTSSFYSPGITSLAVRSTYNLDVDNYYCFKGTALVAVGNDDGPVTATFRNCINASPRYKSGSEMPSEVRYSYAMVTPKGISDDFRVCFDNCNSINMPTYMRDFSVNSGFCEIKNCTIAGSMDVGNCKEFIFHDCHCKTLAFRYNGSTNLTGRIYNLTSDSQVNLCSVADGATGLIDIDCISDDLKGPFNLYGGNELSWIGGNRPHIVATVRPNSTSNGYVVKFNYVTRPKMLTRIVSTSPETQHACGLIGTAGIGTDEIEIVARKYDGTPYTGGYPTIRGYFS